MEILRWSECTRGRDHPMGTPPCLFNAAACRRGLNLDGPTVFLRGWCLDLRVMFCLCCNWLEWCRCNRAWPFKIACGQWLAHCGPLWLRAPLAGASCHRDEGEAQTLPAALPNFIVSLPIFTGAWYDLTPWTRRSRPLLVRLVLCTHQRDEACQACLMLMLDVSLYCCVYLCPHN